MAQSQSADANAPTAAQAKLINDLQSHVSRARFNERTGNVIAAIKPSDDYHGAYLAAEEHGFEPHVFDTSDYSLSVSFK